MMYVMTSLIEIAMSVISYQDKEACDVKDHVGDESPFVIEA